MATVANINVLLSASTAAFSKSMKAASGIVSSFTSSLLSFKGLLAGLGLGLSAGALVAWTKQAADSIDKTGKLAESLNATTEGLVGLQHAAELSGVGQDEFNESLTRMVRTLGDAAQGNNEAIMAFQRLGLDIEHLAALSADDAFIAIADALSKVENASQRASLTVDIFGRSGMKLSNTLALGKDGLMAMQEEAERMGLTFSALDFKKVEAANDAITRVHKVFTGFFQDVAIQFAPIIESLAKQFTDWATSGQRATGLVAKAFGKVIDAVGFLADAIQGVKIGLNVIVVGLSKGFSLLLAVAEKVSKYLAFEFGLDAIHNLKTSVDEFTDKQIAKLGEQLEEPWRSDEVRKWFDSVMQGADAAAQAAENARKPFTGLSDALRDDGKEAEKLLADIERRITHWTDATKTPIEKLWDQFNELNVLIQHGLPIEVYMRGLDMISTELDDLNEKKEQAFGLPQAFEFGTQATESFLAQLRGMGTDGASLNPFGGPAGRSATGGDTEVHDDEVVAAIQELRAALNRIVQNTSKPVIQVGQI